MPTTDEKPFAQVFLHAAWPCSVPLEAAVVDKLGPYLTRYAQTLKTTVHAVGASGAGDALHLLFELPHDKSIDEIVSGLQKPSARYASTTLGAIGLTWAAGEVRSISPDEIEAWKARIMAGDAPPVVPDAPDAAERPDGDPLPLWLTEVLERTRKS